MKLIGPHVHTTGGVQNAPLNAQKVGATAFGLFTKNQRRWVAKPLETSAIDSFKINMEKCGYDPGAVLAHDSYLINIGNPDPVPREQSLDALIDEMDRCRLLGLPWLNIHPGSHVNAVGESECLALIAQSLNRALDSCNSVGIVLEATAGQGSSVGYRFEHLAEIIDKVEDRKRLGVCLDTCHIFAAGYDIRGRRNYEEVMRSFGQTVGFSYIRGLHLNDAKSTLGSRVDRHDSIGKGNIGIEAFRLIMQDSRFDNIPCILETNDETLWPEEIRMLSEMAHS
ncbi:MAG: deoxyribonuclease IV [Chitinispirillaceae bacterium]